MVTRHRFAPDAAFGGWLMPVVPPLVSATTGALLVPHLPAGQPRVALLLGCYAMFGLGVVAVLLVLAMIYSRLVHHDAPTGAMVPTVWIGLGALGQVVTGTGCAGHSGTERTARRRTRRARRSWRCWAGWRVWGFAMLWLALAAALTVREVRAGLPFAPTWWSFIFPLGAFVTATAPSPPVPARNCSLGRRRALRGARRRLGRGGRPLPAPRRRTRPGISRVARLDLAGTLTVRRAHWQLGADPGPSRQR